MADNDYLKVRDLTSMGLGSLESARLSSMKRNAQAENSDKNKPRAEVEKAGRDFEALFIHQMINEMWKSVPNSGMFGNSHDSEIYRDMFNDALAKSISEGQGIGIRDIIIKDIEKQEKGKVASNK